jgi:hypothetical protein
MRFTYYYLTPFVLSLTSAQTVEILRTTTYQNTDCTGSVTAQTEQVEGSGFGGYDSGSANICIQYSNIGGGKSVKLNCAGGKFTKYTNAGCATSGTDVNLGCDGSGNYYSCYSGPGFKRDVYSDASCSTFLYSVIGALSICDSKFGGSNMMTYTGSGYLYRTYGTAFDCVNSLQSVNPASETCGSFQGTYSIFTKLDTTWAPSKAPSKHPIRTPSHAPSRAPKRPSRAPSRSPSKAPKTSQPSRAPSSSPITKAPSRSPSLSHPSKAPQISAPSKTPTISKPSRSPSKNPTGVTQAPTPPTIAVTKSPTTKSPTTSSPSKSPTPPTMPTAKPTTLADLLRGNGPTKEMQTFQIGAAIVGSTTALFLAGLAISCFRGTKKSSGGSITNTSSNPLNQRMPLMNNTGNGGVGNSPTAATAAAATNNNNGGGMSAINPRFRGGG